MISVTFYVLNEYKGSVIAEQINLQTNELLPFDAALLERVSGL